MKKKEIEKRLNDFFAENSAESIGWKHETEDYYVQVKGTFRRSIHLSDSNVCFMAYSYENKVIEKATINSIFYKDIKDIWFDKNRLFVDLGITSYLSYDM